METVDRIDLAREKIREAKTNGKTIGFVPTMGYLHRGHLNLVEISKKHSDYQVMSIFVNKMQFNDKNDFDNYPRDIQKDLKLAEEAGVNLIFMPDDEEMYTDRLTYVDMSVLTEHLCGAHREGHFRGVFTVVSKLFNILHPDISVFGQKDIQQVVCIEKMVYDLNFPVKIIIGPTIREKDGLAMSSRNRHLSDKKRKDALSIYRSLRRSEELLNSGTSESEIIKEEMKRIIEEGESDSLDYISIVGYKDLQPVENITDKSVIAVAAFFGSTRLIDNMVIEKEEGEFICRY